MKDVGEKERKKLKMDGIWSCIDLVSDLRNVILGLIELVKKVDSEEEWKTSSEMLKNCGDVAVSQAVSALYN